MTVFEEAKNWFENNPYFEFKGRAVCYEYGTYEGKNRLHLQNLFIDNPVFPGYRIGGFAVLVKDYDGVCFMKVEAYFYSYCDYDTVFEGIVPSIDFLETLFYESFQLPKMAKFIFNLVYRDENGEFIDDENVWVNAEGKLEALAEVKREYPKASDYTLIRVE